MKGRVEGVSVGRIQRGVWHGKEWESGIFKTPVEGRVRAEGALLAGDEQADLAVHGGPMRAVYIYPAEHYRWWSEQLGSAASSLLGSWGAFGENLTVSGLLESSVSVGDRLRVGSALLEVRSPRMPCWKLGVRFDDASMTQRFYEAERNGYYLSIEEAGEIAEGDVVEVESAHQDRLTIAEVVGLRTGSIQDDSLRAKAARHAALPEEWRVKFGRENANEVAHG